MKRFLTGAVLGVILLLCLFYKGWLLRISLAVITFSCIYELINAFETHGDKPVKFPAYIYGAGAMVLYVGAEYTLNTKMQKFFGGMNPLFLLAALTICVAAAFVIMRGEPDFNAVISSILPIIYPGMLITLLYPLMNLPNPLLTTIALADVVLIAWIGDVFAFIVGSLIGKHKLSPKISPKKSIEGSIAGLVASTLVAMIIPDVFLWFSGFVPSLYDCIGFEATLAPRWAYAILGLTGGVASQFGDLCASLIKRHCGIKDYGSIFPGHGGMLDRFDGVVFLSALCYLFYNYVGAWNI